MFMFGHIKRNRSLATENYNPELLDSHPQELTMLKEMREKEVYKPSSIGIGRKFRWKRTTHKPQKDEDIFSTKQGTLRGKFCERKKYLNRQTTFC
ncbi:hypothetical protein TNCV_3926381 [Trichonephila clavipes]|nr:hypothetical protein TNCV_3926381 [Trichonephila clavipes]